MFSHIVAFLNKLSCVKLHIFSANITAYVCFVSLTKVGARSAQAQSESEADLV